MQAFAINTKQVPILQVLSNKDLHKGIEASFSILSEEKSLDIRLKNIIILAKPQNNDLMFINEGIITKIGEITQVPPSTKDIERAIANGRPSPKEKFRYNYTFQVDKLLQKNNLLSDLQYSLTAVDNHKVPQSHFYQQYRKLQKNDYDTIVNGWVYASRTAFGKLVNAIPRKNKLEFMLQAMDKFDTIDFKSIPLLEGLDFLYEYINSRILSRGKLLVETNKLIHNKLNKQLPADEIGFIDPVTGTTNNLNTQATIFDQLFALEKKADLKSVLNEAIKQNPEVQDHFTRIFNKQTWPIDLRQ